MISGLGKGAGPAVGARGFGRAVFGALAGTVFFAKGPGRVHWSDINNAVVMSHVIYGARYSAIA
jgi:hypothetical protein